MTSETAEDISDRKFFHFPNIKYPDQLNIKNIRHKNTPHNNLMLYACYAASILWGGLIISYGTGIISAYPAENIPVFLPVSIALIAIFPIIMIWVGYVVYKHILKMQETGTAILEAARILASPALIAANDVETLSSSVANELNNLRHALRDIEERVHQSGKLLSEEVNTLNDAGEHLEKTIENVSGKIFRERDTIIDMIKLLKNEKQPHTLPEPRVTRQIKMNNIRKDSSVDENIKQDVSKKINQMVKDNNEANPSPNINMSHTSVEEENYPVKKPTSFSMSDIQPLSETPENYILRVERQLFEGLYALTVDLNRIFETSAPQELWPRYMRGERNVFADYFCQWTRENYDTYRQLSAEENFRKLSNRFIAQFETLRERLFDTPHLEVSEYLERCSIGHVYNLLSAEYI